MPALLAAVREHMAWSRGARAVLHRDSDVARQPPEFLRRPVERLGDNLHETPRLNLDHQFIIRLEPQTGQARTALTVTGTANRGQALPDAAINRLRDRRIRAVVY